MKLSPKKGGHGFVTSYTINLGSKEVREVGFVDEDGVQKPLRKVVDAENHRIIIELDPEGETE